MPSRGTESTKSKANGIKGRAPQESAVASKKIDARIDELGDWRGKALSQVRRLIKKADPDVVEEWKWAKPASPGIPVWSHNGGICTGETYKSAIKLTFFKGASLDDPSHLFTQDGTVRRAIDIHEGGHIDEAAFMDLIRAAVALNVKREGKLKPRRAKR